MPASSDHGGNIVSVHFSHPHPSVGHLLGNLITREFWKVRADRSGNRENMAMTSRSVLFAVYVFTGPGIATLLVTGILLAGLSGWAVVYTHLPLPTKRIV